MIFDHSKNNPLIQSVLTDECAPLLKELENIDIKKIFDNLDMRDLFKTIDSVVEHLGSGGDKEFDRKSITITFPENVLDDIKKDLLEIVHKYKGANYYL